MAYLGNRPATGENNAFRILDDISSHVVSFDGSSASVVSLANDTITITDDKIVTEPITKVFAISLQTSQQC